MDHRYALGLGANIYRSGPPARAIKRALATLEEWGIDILARSRVLHTRPLGPGQRNFANAAVIVETEHAPPALFALVKAIERDFGRRRSRRWGDRVLDIDIILWSGGIWADRDIAIPHPAFRDRAFVLDPLAEIAADWHDPVSGRTIRQLRHRLSAHSPVDRAGAPP
ncbi:MAG: 2-amino-4-hydroxy-6-hydroxymethyldihydropteridine diphosphokinase [Parasphingopyxis sp.]|nr:2-amino-4-hydroxy-6-hydroxymethyldihydropteridine diphosphokinase [Sphingomonadales bacterium]